MRQWTIGLLITIALATPAWGEPGWRSDRNSGCKIWDDNATVPGSATWSGPCANGFGHGRGVAQILNAKGEPELRYEGDMREGRMAGRGIYLFKDGTRYEGEFVNGNFQGQGTMIWTNGNRYVGEWAKDVAHGFGTKTLADGRVFTGRWNNGCLKQGDQWATVSRSPEDCGFK